MRTKVVLPNVLFSLGERADMALGLQSWEQGSMTLDSDSLKITSRGLELIMVPLDKIIEARILKDPESNVAFLIVEYVESNCLDEVSLLVTPEDLIEAVLSCIREE